jgi:nitric oxide reductase NorQ protein
MDGMQHQRPPTLAATPFYAQQGGECALFEHAHASAAAADQGPHRLRQDALRRTHGGAPGPAADHGELPRRPERRRPGGPPPDRRRRHRLGRRPADPRRAQGAICYLDEVVEARKDTTVVLHPLADDRRVLPIERTGELLQAPPGFMLVISYNPGYQNLLKGLKPSTRQRFRGADASATPPETERHIVQAEAAARRRGSPAGASWRRPCAGSPTTTWKKPSAPACW